ncbi:uncharacterized protein LOC126649944 isoform X1 [Myiozetetes cayanensis]|uniref:uncharacterized protein LOC126649944 isoform X1 n=1 Tax=Myiozetetes cayanensis TaxID=478635 RepID=UPI0021603F4F|nr:uncharacterized protein LOC126649944 isoform X1 [Myiozetetes cayanensis]XP_050190292.1 uncharacterized protein LOC126649944 isoform X1 [Myiozetetes cayanensis]XP_050190293.1 uncharacterized protein LOC126649944 isoform X1 [Myiozetetes cayanensis]XP_050190294.1 uncharacterized protein LOC126649944 isoform X1 [Myiozetetes cayanensis]XP_050190295.1 uncharacterized protein LOC126649944 isoform X1 [Myiozetetes cayanensis]
MGSHPSQGMRITLAKATNTNTMCLSLDSVSHPFKSCLVGIPEWNRFIQNTSLVDNFLPSPDTISQTLLRLGTLDTDPQELDLLGSSVATTCFSFTPTTNRLTLEPNISPNSSIYTITTAWCNYSQPYPLPTERFFRPTKLPSTYFLICGDRTWQGILKNPVGGPYTIGKLTLYNPAKLQIIRNQISDRPKLIRNKRSYILMRTKSRPLPVAPDSKPRARKVPQNNPTKEDKLNIHVPPDCDPKFQTWSHTQRFWGSFPLANIGAAKALSTLAHIACWMASEANATSLAIGSLLADTLKIKEATLQNRAAIDVLLLAHGHGCQEFEGLCCLNFSDHSESVFQSINTLKQLVNDITINQDKGFSGLFSWLHFPSLSDWANKIVKGIILFLIITFSILVFLLCLIFCVKKYITKSFSQAFPVLKNREGGNVRGGPEEAYRSGERCKRTTKKAQKKRSLSKSPSNCSCAELLGTQLQGRSLAAFADSHVSAPRTILPFFPKLSLPLA